VTNTPKDSSRDSASAPSGDASLPTLKGLSDEQIELLASLPWRAGWEITCPREQLESWIDDGLVTGTPVRGDGKRDYYPTPAADILLNTLANREREVREEVGVAEMLPFTSVWRCSCQQLNIFAATVCVDCGKPDEGNPLITCFRPATNPSDLTQKGN
jgi:hypothetical protein